MFAKDKPSHAVWWYLQGSLSWGAGAMAEEAVSLPGALGADDYCWCVCTTCVLLLPWPFFLRMYC